MRGDLSSTQRGLLATWGLFIGLAGVPLGYLGLLIAVGVPDDNEWLFLLTWPALVAALLPFLSGASAFYGAWSGRSSEASRSFKLALACACILGFYGLALWVAVDILHL